MGNTLEQPIKTKSTFEADKRGLRFAVSSMQGWRTTMEDEHLIILPGDLDDSLPDHSIVAVFDGHGGSLAAEYAKKGFIRELKRSRHFHAYVSSGDPRALEDAVKAAYLSLDEALRQEQESVTPPDDSGSTAVCAMITPSHIVVGNCGDSRAVIYSGTHGTPKQLSQDHKPDLDEERSRIEAAGGVVQGGRVDSNLSLSRALGDFKYKDASLPPEQQKVTAMATTICYQRSPEDKMLILACDGIWDVCTNSKVFDLMATVPAEGDSSLIPLCNNLLDACLARNSMDNITAVVVAFPGFKPDELHSLGARSPSKPVADDSHSQDLTSSTLSPSIDRPVKTSCQPDNAEESRRVVLSLPLHSDGGGGTRSAQSHSGVPSSSFTIVPAPPVTTAAPRPLPPANNEVWRGETQAAFVDRVFRDEDRQRLSERGTSICDFLGGYGGYNPYGGRAWGGGGCPMYITPYAHVGGYAFVAQCIICAAHFSSTSDCAGPSRSHSSDCPMRYRNLPRQAGESPDAFVARVRGMLEAEARAPGDREERARRERDAFAGPPSTTRDTDESSTFLSSRLRHHPIDMAKASDAAEKGAAALVEKQPYRAHGVTLEARLGQTISGQAILMRGRRSSTAVVVKVFYGGPAGQEAFSKEKSVMDRLGRAHAHLMYYLQDCSSPLPAIVYPLLRGSLDTMLEESALSPTEAREYAKQVASALRHMHRNNVAHFDLKAANILVEEGGTIRLGDFTRAIFVNSTQMVTLTTSLSLAVAGSGPVSYMAPEVLDGRIGDRIKPFKNDVYGFGILLWELQAGNPPYTHLPIVPREARAVTIHKEVCRRGGRPQPIGASWEAEMVALMKKCWATDSAARPDVEAICRQLGVA